ncbi:hypothetical protein ABVT39_007427 [Epinephelus coioides]
MRSVRGDMIREVKRQELMRAPDRDVCCPDIKRMRVLTVVLRLIYGAKSGLLFRKPDVQVSKSQFSKVETFRPTSEGIAKVGQYSIFVMKQSATVMDQATASGNQDDKIKVRNNSEATNSYWSLHGHQHLAHKSEIYRFL